MSFADGFKELAKKHKTALIAGGVTVGGIVAAPLVIPAAVGTLGFGAGGIVAGSTAAWLMSLGGGVTPGAVAVMQSIGATGAISASTSLITGGISGLTAGAVRWFARKKNPNEEETQTNEEEANAQNENEKNEAKEEEEEKSNKMGEEEVVKKDNVKSEDKLTQTY